MSTQTQLSDAPPRDAYLIHEAATISLAEGALRSDGTVELIIIRPGEGRGKGSHYYSADMLQENAHKFSGWKMFVDHQAPEAKKAAGGLPRSLRDLGGVILESWWDGSVPAEGRHEAGAVKGRARPIGIVKALIEEAPELVEASISTTATGVKSLHRDGKRLWAVEGIADTGSVDWVTEAGAGGRVIRLMEAMDTTMESLDALSDEEFTEYLRAQRPELLEALASGYDGDHTGNGGQNVGDAITAETLAEALATEEGRATLLPIVHEVLRDEARGIVGELLESERDMIRAEARIESQRPIQLRDLRDKAHMQIDEARLPATAAQHVKSKFDVDADGNPTEPLDVIDDVDENFNVVKTAAEKLTEAVDAEIAQTRELLASANPTRVRGQGSVASGGEEGTERELPPVVRELLTESGFNDPDKVYAASA